MASDPAPQKAAGSPRFVPIAVAMAGLLILAAGGLLGFALLGGPKDAAGGAIGGPFHLVDQNGKAFTEADLKGKWHLVFFGYTHCTDTCPTTLNNLSLALDRIGRERAAVGIVFITVDPKRDTPAILKSYVASFAAPIVALSGSADEIKEAAQDYRVYYAVHPRAGGAYDVDHSAVIYVMDPQGRFTATLSPDATPQEIAARLRDLLS